jgi:hypothetical protein
MKHTSVADDVRQSLVRGSRPASLRIVANEAGVGYEWLVKFTHGHISEPGAVKLDRVREAVRRLKRVRAAA